MLDPENPFAAPSPLPFAFPPFDAIRTEHFRPAFEAGVGEHRAEVEAVATSTDAPTFENTVAALERSGRVLERVLSVLFNLAASTATDEIQALEEDIAPRYAAHLDEIRLDQPLFARIEVLHRRRDELDLTEEQQRVLERYHADFVRAGAALPEADRQRLRDLNGEISRLSTRFGNRLLAEANSLAVHVTDAAELDGLADDAVEAAAGAAATRGLDGWLLTLSSPTVQPVLSSLRNRDLRRRVYQTAVRRGGRGGDHDTRALLTRLAALRAERAGLLGYADHAAYVVADQTAGSSAAVLGMLTEMAGPARRNLAAEQEQLTTALREDGVRDELRGWDWAYYAARVKAAAFDLDPGALRPHFELERVLHDGIFHAAARLYGVGFREREDLPVYAEGVRVFEVGDADGSALGLFVCDWYARPTKRGGAWMNEFVGQSRLLGTRPVVVVCLNVPEPSAGRPTLMTVDEVRTAFHEFGHALHGLFSDAVYPRLSGTQVPRDFVEFPSQVNEMWAWHPEVLGNYAVHHETGEPLDPVVVARLLASQSHGQGFDTVSMLGAVLLDQEWHRLPPSSPPVPEGAVEAFESAALARHDVRSELVPPRYRSSYFAHVFAGGYDASYYSYLWSEVLDADLVDWFTEHGGPTRENGETFRTRLLARGGTVDPMAAFAAVRGRGPSTEPLLRRRGLVE